MSVKTIITPSLELHDTDKGNADAEKWWFSWMLSAEIEITSASKYALSFARKNLNPSHLTYFSYEILKEFGIKSIGDRLKILRRSSSYFHELRYQSTKKRPPLNSTDTTDYKKG